MTAYVNRAVMEECRGTPNWLELFLSPPHLRAGDNDDGVLFWSESRTRIVALHEGKRKAEWGKQQRTAANSSQTNKLECTMPRVTVFFAVPRVERWMHPYFTVSCLFTVTCDHISWPNREFWARRTISSI